MDDIDVYVPDWAADVFSSDVLSAYMGIDNSSLGRSELAALARLCRGSLVKAGVDSAEIAFKMSLSPEEADREIREVEANDGERGESWRKQMVEEALRGEWATTYGDTYSTFDLNDDLLYYAPIYVLDPFKPEAGWVELIDYSKFEKRDSI